MLIHNASHLDGVGEDVGVHALAIHNMQIGFSSSLHFIGFGFPQVLIMRKVPHVIGVIRMLVPHRVVERIVINISVLVGR